MIETFAGQDINKEIRPPLKWAGGKRWLLQYLRPLWEPYRHRRFVEPFCGGLAATLGLMPERALVNDVNPHIMNFYRWLKKGLSITVPMEKDEKLYYDHRKRFNELQTNGQRNTREAAALFYYLNRTGYNGLCRFNQRGAFNVPFGRYSNINYVRNFSPYKRVFAGWTFLNADFERVRLLSDDFVYADPPYDVEFTQYSKGGFGWDEQLRAARFLARHPGPVILSNQATRRIVSLYRDLGFSLRFLQAPRRISCNGDRNPVREVLALRNLS